MFYKMNVKMLNNTLRDTFNPLLVINSKWLNLLLPLNKSLSETSHIDNLPII